MFRCDLIVHIGAVLKQQFHEFHIQGAASAGLCGKTGSTAVAGADSSRNEKRRETHSVDVGISDLLER